MTRKWMLISRDRRLIYRPSHQTVIDEVSNYKAHQNVFFGEMNMPEIISLAQPNNCNMRNYWHFCEPKIVEVHILFDLKLGAPAHQARVSLQTSSNGEFLEPSEKRSTMRSEYLGLAQCFFTRSWFPLPVIDLWILINKKIMPINYVWGDELDINIYYRP